MKKRADSVTGGNEFRSRKPPEQIRMYGFEGKCRYCKTGDGQPGIVKMMRDFGTLELRPDRCWCLLCGQRYFVQVKDLKVWEERQWRQKAERVG